MDFILLHNYLHIRIHIGTARRIACTRLWIKRANQGDCLQHILQRYLQRLCNRRKLVLANLLQIVVYNHDGNLGVGDVFKAQLNQQAFLKASGTDSGRLKGLYLIDRILDVIQTVLWKHALDIFIL